MSQMNQKQDVNSNSRGCLLKGMEGESDSEVPEFSLPPKSVVKRPRKTIKKRTRSRWRKYCRSFCRYCSGVVLGLVLTACVLSIVLLFWFSLRLYRDVENLSRRLTIEINRVQAEQAENIEKCNALKVTMEQDIKKNRVWQRNITYLKRQLHVSFSKIALMNGTLVTMLHQLHDANNKVILKAKVDALQKGMADTGAEITKLSDELKHVEKQAFSQSSVIKRISSGLWNISQELANVTGKPKPAFQSLDYSLDSFNVDENKETKEPAIPEKNSVLSAKSLSDIVEMVNAVNHSLLSKVRELQIENLALKMKSNGYSSDMTLPRSNLSRAVVGVQRELSSIQQSLRKLSSLVHNLTRLTNLETSLTKLVNINTNEIKLLWNELEMQNDTLVDIEQRIDEVRQYGSELPQQWSRETATTQPVDDFQISKPNDQSTSENRRDVSDGGDASESFQSKVDRKHSDTYRDLMKDNKYIN